MNKQLKIDELRGERLELLTWFVRNPHTKSNHTDYKRRKYRLDLINCTLDSLTGRKIYEQ